MTTGAGISSQTQLPRSHSADADLAPPLAIPSAGGAGRAGRIGRDRATFYRAPAIAAVLMLATALRVYGLTRQSAWADEITTLFIADPSHSFGRFWDLVLADTHPPLFYLLMRWWSAPFGQPDLAPPVPTLILGVATVASAAVPFKGP